MSSDAQTLRQSQVQTLDTLLDRLKSLFKTLGSVVVFKTTAIQLATHQTLSQDRAQRLMLGYLIA